MARSGPASFVLAYQLFGEENLDIIGSGLAQINGEGTELWHRSVQQRINALRGISGSGIVFVGSQISDEKIVATKLNESGEVAWTQSFPSDRLGNAILSVENRVLIAGNKGDDPWIVVLDSEGKIISETTFEATDADVRVYDSVSLSNDSILLIGRDKDQTKGWVGEAKIRNDE